MIKNFLFAVAVLSLALAMGCAKGGNGSVTPPVTLDVAITSPQDVAATAVYATQSVTVTATPSSGPDLAVTWTLTGGGTLTPVSPATTPPTATYVAPATATTGITITATATSDSSITGNLPVGVVDVSVVVTPVNVNVGESLMQYFTAVAVPDAAPQTFTWNCTGVCASLVQDQSTSGLALYTAPASSGSAVVSATSTVPQSSAGVGQSNVKVAASRLAQGTYAFRFTGYDSASNAVAVAGSVNVASTPAGSITSGVEDVVINGTYEQYTTVSGSYTPTSNNNNLGTLTLSAAGGPTYSYTAVLTSSGTIRMIESDSSGISGSGVMQKSAANTVFNAGAQTFAFGLEGLDVNGNRIGYVGLLPMTPGGTGGTIAGGLADVNDNGAANSYSNVMGSYSTNPIANSTCGSGTWNMQLTAGGATLNFDFFVAGGQTKTSSDPLTLYAISCDATNQALSGNMAYQFPMSSGYNNAAFSGTSVSSLRGVHVASSAEVPNTSDVALVDGTTDGTSTGSGGTGGFTGTSDQNDNGSLTSITASAFSYTYCSTSTTSSTCTPSSGTGRYIFNMLGNPNVSPAVSSVPFVLYASGANRGFLLDQSSRAVMTGEMAPQPSLKNFDYTPSELPGTYAVATIGNSDPALAPEVQNLLLTSTGGATYVVAGTEYTKSASESIAGSYTINFSSPGAGTGTITLTNPVAPLVTNYVIYAIDASAISGTGNDVITDFMMMGLTSGTPSAIMFAQQ